MAAEAWSDDLGDALVSLVLFGSVARGDAGPTSDIDVLVVAHGVPRSLADRRRPLLAASERARTARGLPDVVWNLVVKSPGILIVDRDGAFAAVLSGMSRMGRLDIEEARGRLALVQLALEKGLWAATVREAQECVELYLKGALRLVAVEPTRTHDVAAILRREVARFPEWFGTEVNALASISTELAGDRGAAFYGDARSSAPRNCSISGGAWRHRS